MLSQSQQTVSKAQIPANISAHGETRVANSGSHLSSGRGGITIVRASIVSSAHGHECGCQTRQAPNQAEHLTSGRGGITVVCASIISIISDKSSIGGFHQCSRIRLWRPN